MSRPSLLITRPLPAPVAEAARALCAVDMRAKNSPLSEPEIAEALTRYDAILPTLGDRLTDAAFYTVANPKCRLIANFGVGYNHIDVAAAEARGICVTNTPGAVTDATADIAITLILMVARRAGEGERLVRSGGWRGWHPTQLLGQHIGGKTLGIVGMGRIGRAVARRAHFGFGMNVIFFNRSFVRDCTIPQARQVASLAELFSQSDVISVNVPGGAENHHLIDAKVLAMARPDSILVNTARGDVIDEDALINALESGALAGAGLDVYAHEPQVPEALMRLENVTLLPHLGTNSLEVRTNMGLMALENIRSFFAGETPPNQVQNPAQP